MERLGSCIAFLNDVVSLRFVVVVHSWPAGLGKTICPFDSGEDIGPVNGGTVFGLCAKNYLLHRFSKIQV